MKLYEILIFEHNNTQLLSRDPAEQGGRIPSHIRVARLCTAAFPSRNLQYMFKVQLFRLITRGSKSNDVFI